MPNDFDAQQLTNDGSLTDAAMHMPDLEPFDDERRGQPRDPQNGQWTRQQQEAADARAAQPTKPEALAEQVEEDIAPVDDEYFEIPSDKDGEPAKRIKAVEVFEGYQERERLRVELEEAKRGQPPPEAFDHAIIQAATARDQLIRQMRVYQQALRPQQPDMELINEDSPKYNPGLYQRQMAAAQHQQHQLSAIQQEIDHMESMQREQVEAVSRAQFAREQSKLHQFWPEIRDPKEASRVRDNLISAYGKYGMTPELIGSIHNSVFYALAKDALAYRQGLKAREAAVKVVRAKPKLVRGQARDPQSPNNRRATAGFDRLRVSGALDDATDALEGLI